MRNENYPKTLIISHNVFSPHSSMGKTLMNFFKGWNCADIAQLYLHTEIPTTHLCENYYRITDFDNIKKRKKDIGTVFSTEDIDETIKSERVDKGTQAKLYQYGRKRKPYMYLGRNFIWGLNKWDNAKLNEWIDNFNPDVIFFASGDYSFAYKIAMKIAQRRNIPIITYICDDYYFVSQKKISPLYYISRIQYRSAIKKLLNSNKTVVSICDKLSGDYAKEFGIDAHTVMTSSSLSAKSGKADNGEVKISYLGNLSYNRYIALAEIGQALKKASGGKVFLDIYSTETRPEVLKYLTEENGIKFHGAVAYDEVIRVMNSSDILVHTEAMDAVNREKVKYSVSTKIADSLACGTCLFAYGPNDVASMEYLIDNNCACVVTEKSKLEDSLKKLISNRDLREQYVEKAVSITEKNHNINKNAEIIKQIIAKVSNNYESTSN